jgi:hypothetical protein
VRAVLQNPLDYSLQGKAIIVELGLSEENYSDALFIHPPLFVYTSALLHWYCSMPLPAVSLLMQGVVLLLLPVISERVIACMNTLARVSFAASNKENLQTQYDPFSTPMLHSEWSGATAKLMLVCCPIVAFCAQKFWIDNALMMAVTICVAVHVTLIQPIKKQEGVTRQSLGDSVINVDGVKTIFSGLVFGAVGLNSKITALALLPFSLAWTVLIRIVSDLIESTELGRLSDREKILRVVYRSAVDCALFVCGALIGYGPWCAAYWVRM